MSTLPKRYTITAALPYTNGPIHIGHLAGVYVPADIYARYLRLRDRDVAFICGSDEHGVAIDIKAKKEGKTPQQVIDHYDQIIREAFDAFGISFDNYSRTSRKIHHETASKIFIQLHEKNQFIIKETEQLYDSEAKAFLADRFVVGTCPICQHEEAYGDQCESCGSSLNATDLINPRSTLSGSKPELKKTKHWFLPLDQHEEFIENWILKEHKKDWKPNVYGQVKSWVDNGLQARAVTRDLDWGIPVPVDGGEGKVLYVWFDAPIGYISSTKEWAKKKNIDWEPYWKSQDTQLVHFIGKDNIVFHCIIFPIILNNTKEYILPENVPANEFLNLEGQKISTSKNWAVWLHEYLIDFPEQQDVLRYVLTANAPETKDNDFTWKEFQTRNNSELVAIFGNFINRVMVLKRISDNEEFLSTHRIVNVLRNLGDITVRSSLTDYCFKLSETLLLAQAKFLTEIEEKKDIFYTSSRGVGESNIVVSSNISPLLEEVFSQEICTDKLDKLSAITVKLPTDNVKIPGIYYFIFQRLSWEGVNINQVISTSNEFTILMDEDSINVAFEVIKNLKSL